jgi:hypothetical protein
MFDKVDHDMSSMIKEAVFKAKGEAMRRKSESLKANEAIKKWPELTMDGAMNSVNDKGVV